MIKDDPNYRLPKEAFIRLFDNPIPAGDPARSEAPEWAQELDEVVVWAHMGDNGEVTVKVNGEDIGGGGGGDAPITGSVTITPATGSIDFYSALPLYNEGVYAANLVQISTQGNESSAAIISYVVFPSLLWYGEDNVLDLSLSTGDFTVEGSVINLNGPCNLVFVRS